MKQSKRLISERRVRAYIYETFQDLNPDNKPREISQKVYDALDTVVKEAVQGLVFQAPCLGGRLIQEGRFFVEYWPQGEKL
jgi:hypothetical protein